MPTIFLADNPILKVMPHINDSLLLTSGIALISLSGFVPFTPAAPWLSIKLMSVVAYILCGAFALKSKQTWQRWGFFLPEQWAGSCLLSISLLASILYLTLSFGYKVWVYQKCHSSVEFRPFFWCKARTKAQYPDHMFTH